MSEPINYKSKYSGAEIDELLDLVKEKLDDDIDDSMRVLIDKELQELRTQNALLVESNTGLRQELNDIAQILDDINKEVV